VNTQRLEEIQRAVADGDWFGTGEMREVLAEVVRLREERDRLADRASVLLAVPFGPQSQWEAEAREILEALVSLPEREDAAGVGGGGTPQ
jgi:hypothetical protein